MIVSAQSNKAVTAVTINMNLENCINHEIQANKNSSCDILMNEWRKTESQSLIPKLQEQQCDHVSMSLFCVLNG